VLGLREGEEIDSQGEVGRGQGIGRRKRATLTGGPQASAAKKVTNLGFGDTGAWAPSGVGPNRCPAAFSYFTLLLFLFLFLNSGFIRNFCKIHSNQFKQVSKFF
jgi:hypothetical protein